MSTTTRTVRKGIVILKAAPTDTGQCGTPGGFSIHRRRDEHPCSRCQAAERDRERTYRGRQRAWQDREALGLPVTFGRFAATNRLHLFTPLFPEARGSRQCAECFGWPDDPRHQGEEGAAA